MNVQEAILQERIDPALTDGALTALAEQAGYVGSVDGYEVLTGGCWNRVIAIRAGGEPLVVKISPQEDDQKIIREFAVLEAFAERTALTVPQPLVLSQNDTVPGTALVMTRIPGAVMHEVYGLLNFGQRRAISRQIARDLAALHKTREPGFGGVELDQVSRSTTWPDFWLPRYRAVLEQAGASGALPADVLEGARAVEPLFAEPLAIGATGTWTHYDVWSGNVMIDLEGDEPRVSGYIDIPGFYADYARELSFAMLFGVADRAFFETYTEVHPLDDAFELRANIYNLKMNIKHIQMYPTQLAYQQGARSNLQFIREHLS